MKIKHRALALILTAMMVLTYMPALAFADDGDDSERGEMTSLEFIHQGKYEVEGYMDADGYWDKNANEWVTTSDPYLMFDPPGVYGK